MSLFAALDAAVSSLNVINSSVNVTSQNIANAQNDAYNTQKVIVEDLIAGGVKVSEIRRSINLGLRNQLMKETNTAADAEIRDALYRQLEQVTGTIAGRTPLIEAVEKFTSAWKAFEAAPESEAAEADVILQGQAIAAELQRLSAGLDAVKRQLDAEVFDTVEQLNNSLAEVFRLNAAIVREKNSFRPTAEFENLRDAELLKISEIIDIQVIERANGTAAVYATNGLDLVDATASVFTWDPATLTLSKTGVSGNVRERLTAGRLKAQIEVVATDAASVASRVNGVGAIQKFKNQLDELAFTFLDVSTTDATGSRIVGRDQDLTAIDGIAAGDTITLNVGGGDQTVTVAAGETAASLIAKINALTNIDARLDAHGQIQILSRAGALTLTDTAGTTARTLGLIANGAASQTFAERRADTFSYAYKVERSLGTTAIEGAADLTAIAGIDDGDQFSVSVGGGAATTITINTGDSAADLLAALNGIEGVRARFVNGALEISSTEGQLTLANVTGTPLDALGNTFVSGSPFAGEANDFFTVRAGNALENASRVNIQVNDTLVNGVARVKKLSGNDVVAALTGKVRSMSGSGVALRDDSYSGLAGSILTQLTKQAEIAQRNADRSSTLRDDLFGALRNEVGVNIDEELARLTVLQNSFAATARVISIVDQMFASLESIVR